MTNSENINGWGDYLVYGERLFFQRKEVIYRENEDCAKGFYYVKEGLIKITAINHTGENHIIDIVSDEKPFGEQAADGELYFSTASVIKESIIYFFPYDKITGMMAEDDRFRMLIYSNLTDKLHTLSNNLLFNSLPAEKILARTILVLSEKFASEIIPFSQQELCHYTNLNRITIYNTLKKWDINVVSINKKMILIKNRNTLKKIADI